VGEGERLDTIGLRAPERHSASSALTSTGLAMYTAVVHKAKDAPRSTPSGPRASRCTGGSRSSGSSILFAVRAIKVIAAEG